jgi:hypothetical protein
MLSRDVVESVGGFDEAFRLAEETEFFHRVAAVSPLGIVTTPLFRWRVGQVVSLVSAQNMVTLIRNALLSGERAAALRSPLPAAASETRRAGRLRLLGELAYAELSLKRGGACRAAVRKAWEAGGGGPRLAALYALSFLPPAALDLLHTMKRGLR